MKFFLRDPKIDKLKNHWLLLVIALISSHIILISCTERNKQIRKLDGLQVPEGFTIERAVSSDLISYPMFATFDDRGRLFVFESTEPNTMGTEAMLEDPSYHIRLLEDTDGDAQFDKSTIYTDQIPFPMGGVFYNGSLYTTASPDLLKLTDTNGDGKADKRESLLTGWTLNSNAAILSGPFMGPDGWLYMADARRGYAIKTKEGDTLRGKGARIWRTKPDGSGLEWMSAGGFDNSIEIAFMPTGETIGTMTYFTDPQNGQRDALMHWVEGGVYPKNHAVVEQDQLKLTGDLMPVMTKFPRIAPSGLMRYKGTFWGKEYQGNLFSAIFNTGEVMRHIIKKDGATYATKDEPFVTATKEDIHPTDVLEGADGSLLVVVTGGWFIEGCPLSRVAKPNVKGGIYRIRKVNDKEQVKDPWGRAINFSDLPAEQLTELFSDTRPKVQKKAIKTAVQRGASSIGALQRLLSSPDVRVRTAAIFTLYRIKEEGALAIARSGLSDESAMVRTASARVAGLARDKKAVEKLGELVQKDRSPAVRRQAATALGQIGDTGAVEALLKASDGMNDRFVEHAIIHSLTILNQPEPLTDALAKASNKEKKKAAVIALDQMDSSPLTKAQLLPFLSSKDKELRDTGVWIASHHPEWSEIVVDFIKMNIGVAELSDEEKMSFLKLMVTFCGNENLQRLLGTKLVARKTSKEAKLLVIDAMSRCDIQKLPSFWISSLRKELTTGTDEVRTAILSLVETRQIADLGQKLEHIIHSPEESAGFKLKAMKARVETDPLFSEKEFNMIINYLDDETESPLRQSAARLLGRAKLSEQQLLTIARDQLPQADLLLVPGLIESFQGNQNKKVGLALVEGLKKSTDLLDNVSQQDLQDLINTYPESVQTAANPLMDEIQKKQSERLTKLQELEDQLSDGDVGEGRKLFFGKSTCSTCHAVGSEGSDFGPDLSNIGEIRSRHDLLEAILYPSVSFARGYEIYQVRTSSNTYSGVIENKLSSSIMLSIAPGQEVRIPRDDISSIKPNNISLMPPGLHRQLSTNELSDLIAFLEALPYDFDRLLKLDQKNR